MDKKLQEKMEQKIEETFSKISMICEQSKLCDALDEGERPSEIQPLLIFLKKR